MKYTVMLTALLGTAMLAACGNDDKPTPAPTPAPTASTPAPSPEPTPEPTPTPTFTYKMLNELTGDQMFDTACSRVDFSDRAANFGAAPASFRTFGSNYTLGWTSTSDATLEDNSWYTYDGGKITSMLGGPTMLSSFTADPLRMQYAMRSEYGGNEPVIISAEYPASARHVQHVSQFIDRAWSGHSRQYCVFGAPTDIDDLPSSGVISYPSMGLTGTIYESGTRASDIRLASDGSSLTVDFAANTVTGSMKLQKRIRATADTAESWVDLAGTIPVSATIDRANRRIIGTTPPAGTSGNYGIHGWFFGPQAANIGFVFGDSVPAIGTFAASREVAPATSAARTR
ncbi:hypothetical protein GRI97_12110 [Altererythrobacter xixiisoli]|uniref:Transferrin-binding protein B C-lobe/N-lobe beta-barrel domain-containing protein n=1 Tax=Croceibacterium xixiisoli TaxID=1476466 RepID=A0A6I4TZE2_9SPHN|nr:transferrin-binding protein-like solute binding protein [Croceibacterium xixiisoli]MXO99733.1 hypothetical protein [Croceibacterium xixiisoli]